MSKLSREEVEMIAAFRSQYDEITRRLAKALLAAWDALEPFAQIKDTFRVPDDGRAMITLECKDIEAARKALPQPTTGSE